MSCLHYMYVCLHIAVSNTYVVFFYNLLTDSLDCLLLMAPSVFSNVYLHVGKLLALALEMKKMEDIMDRVRLCCLGTGHQRPLLIPFLIKNYCKFFLRVRGVAFSIQVTIIFFPSLGRVVYLYGPLLEWCIRMGELRLYFHTLVFPRDTSLL